MRKKIFELCFVLLGVLAAGCSTDPTGKINDASSDIDAASTLPSVNNYSDFGPFEFTSETETGPDGTYTIVRPKTLGVLGEERFLHAPIIFGPGIGSAPSSLMPLLERIASHGFVIISKTLNAGPGSPENNRRMIDGLDWLIAQNNTPDSLFEGKLAVDRAISMGYSVGGTAAVDVAGHDAIIAVVSIHGHSAKPIDETSASFLLMGGTKDIMRDGQSWLAPTYEALEAQTLFSLVEDADHGYITRTANGVQGGVETPAMIAWIRYWAYNDNEAKKYFFGDDCIMSQSPWTNLQRKNWE
ncbi:MAG: dienelactone hydrolase family protein [Pontiellaceae bacterium]|nr:dienelactone hydrolase family protein [Pontiellaceae bacterium]